MKYTSSILSLATLLLMVMPINASAQRVCSWTDPNDFHTNGQTYQCFGENNEILSNGGGDGGTENTYVIPPYTLEPADPVSEFSNIFLIDDNINHSTVYDVVVHPTAHLGVNEEEQIGMTYDFPYSGVWYVSACADDSESREGTILESNEYNNCTAWMTVVTTDILQPDITASITAIIPMSAGSLDVTLKAIIFNLGNAATNE